MNELENNPSYGYNGLLQEIRDSEFTRLAGKKTRQIIVALTITRWLLFRPCWNHNVQREAITAGHPRLNAQCIRKPTYPTLPFVGIICGIWPSIDSQSSSSSTTTEKIESVREQILQFFNASSKSYQVVSRTALLGFFTLACWLLIMYIYLHQGVQMPYGKWESGFPGLQSQILCIPRIHPFYSIVTI